MGPRKRPEDHREGLARMRARIPIRSFVPWEFHDRKFQSFRYTVASRRSDEKVGSLQSADAVKLV